MDSAYRAGWGGHLEATWASILDFHGCSLEAIGGDGGSIQPGHHHHRFYTVAKPNARCDLLAPGTARAKPPMLRHGSTPDRPHHPVKPFKLRPEVKLALREERVWQGARRRSSSPGCTSTARGR